MKPIYACIVVGILVVTAVAAGALTADAQASPELFLSWRSNAYGPPQYPGKALPARGSTVSVAVAAVQKGKLINPANLEVRWFVNDKLRASGVGKTTFPFAVPTVTGDAVVVRAVLPELAGAPEAAAPIPVVQPSVVLDAPYPGGRLPRSGARLRGVPFSFSSASASLSFSWVVNGTAATEGADAPDTLDLDLTALSEGTLLDVAVTVENPTNPIERASTARTFTVE